jgi:hypothetical protein
MVSQDCPHAPQVVVDPMNVSQPLVSGALVLQSAYPEAQPAYVQVVPLQDGISLWDVSQTLPQPAQLSTVLVGVSQPLRSGAVVVQSAKPGLHPV